MKRIAHLSDLHFGTESPAVLGELEHSLRRFEPHLVVVTGDLTQRARRHEFERARRFLEALAFPRLIVPGNHDIAPVYRPLARLLSPFARYQRCMGAPLDSVYSDGQLLVLGVSTVQPWRWKEGTISDRQLAWIADVARNTPARVRILAAHHPTLELHEPRSMRLLRRHVELRRVLAAADVSVCLSGHLHRSFSGPARSSAAALGPLLAVHAATATSRRLRGEANAYNQLTIDGPRIQVGAAAYDGRRFELAEPRAYEREAGSWRRVRA